MHQDCESEEVIRGRFLTLECLGRSRKVECRRCGCEFVTDDKGTKNAVFDWEIMDHVPLCPLCATRGGGDHPKNRMEAARLQMIDAHALLASGHIGRAEEVFDYVEELRKGLSKPEQKELDSLGQQLSERYAS